MKHTPGPWTIDSFAQIGNDKSIIGRVYCGDIYPNEDLPECTANARLIAAAPDLLEALIMAYDTLKASHPLFNEWVESKVIESAIKKAKGE